MELQREDRLVLLFYKELERNSFVRGDRYLKRIARPVYQRLTGRQTVSGFLMWKERLVEALRHAGYDVRVNDYRTARRHPQHPVGIIGYPHLLDGWDLPNPAVLGPAMHDHPGLAPELMQDPRYRLFLLTCPWIIDLFSPVFGRDKCGLWYGSIDTTEWDDVSDEPKDIDVLVYDKVRWNREHYEPTLIDPITRALDARGLTHHTIRYRHYQHDEYKSLLARSRSMLFLCEHETQGMAYQEAMAANVPIIAWDNGLWLDPRFGHLDSRPVPASSVPYFGPDCGERFADGAAFEPTFDRFWSRRNDYRPREYVRRELSPEGSAELYMRYYKQVGAATV